MKKRYSNKKQIISTTNIIYASIIVILILAVAFIAPFLIYTINENDKKGHWDSIKSTEFYSNNSTINYQDLVNKNPNYVVNKSVDKTYEINANSYIEWYYSPSYGKDVIPIGSPKDDNDGHAFMLSGGGGYYTDSNGINFFTDNDNDFQIVVTTANNTPVSNVPLIVTAIAKESGAMSYIFGLATNDWITMLYQESIVCDGGVNNNIYYGKFDEGWGGMVGCYNEYLIQITMPDTLNNYYGDFSMTDAFLITIGRTIYVRLLPFDNGLLDIQKELKESPDLINTKPITGISGCGYWDGNQQGINNAFVSMDFTNITGYEIDGTRVYSESLYPHVSLKNNDCYWVSLYRLVRFNTDYTNVNEATLGFRYLFFDEHNNSIVAETYGMSYKIDNVLSSTGAVTDYYIISTHGYLNLEGCRFSFILYAHYITIGGQENIEFLGKTFNMFDNENYIIGFRYTYNVYFSSMQSINRELYDDNCRLQIMVCFNSPYYLTNNITTIKIRYMVTTDLDELNTQNPDMFDFHLYIEIIDNNYTYYQNGWDVTIRDFIVGQKVITVDFTGLNIKEVTSYGLNIICNGNEPDDPYTRHSNIYSHALFFILTNYNDFMADVKNLDDLIALLTEKGNMSEAIYNTLDDIISVTKPKIDDIEKSINEIADYWGYDLTDNLCLESIAHYKDYCLWLKGFMDKYEVDEVKTGDCGLFTEFRDFCCRLKFWYADSFTQYNAFIADVKGEHQINDEIKNTTKGYRDVYTDKWVADSSRDVFRIAFWVIFMLALMLALILTLIAYYIIKRKTQNKVVIVLMCILLFIMFLAIFYFVIEAISGSLLGMYYGVD